MVTMGAKREMKMGNEGLDVHYLTTSGRRLMNSFNV